MLVPIEIVGKLYDSKNIGIKINVTESKRKDFSAVGQHNDNPMILRVDSDGGIYIKVNLEELEAFFMLIEFMNKSTQLDRLYQVLQFPSTLFSLN